MLIFKYIIFKRQVRNLCGMLLHKFRADLHQVEGRSEKTMQVSWFSTGSLERFVDLVYFAL